MHSLSPTDPGRTIDWGKTSGDYAAYRPGPPDSFYQRLVGLGVGLPGQRILDLGTGTGAVARRYARQGAQVCGIDVSSEQIDMARHLAVREGWKVDFRIAPAVRIPFPDGSFEVVTAHQAWLYFNAEQTIEEVRRLLVPGGLLVTSHHSWLPRLDPIARRSEALVLKYNPQWSAGDWSGEIPACPPWAEAKFRVRAMFYYDEPIPFTRETWQGRIRSCRGIGASLPAIEVERFDQEHAKLLLLTAPESFTVLHRIDAHLLEFR